MKLNTLGEFGFISRFAPHFEHLIDNADGGIGDDCALLSIDDEHYHLVSTDLLVEDVHFLKDKISAHELGYKALAVNLSDIAAMGGRALYSFLSIGIPPNTEVSYLDEFMAGYLELSDKYKVALMGGDTTSSDKKIIINVAVIGHCPKQLARLRSMAQEGDLICTSGPLGGSAAGLKILLENKALSDENKRLIQYHHLPEPRLEEGLFLAQYPSVHAMMDISDGLSSDLKHLLKASNKSAVVDIDKIPQPKLLNRLKKHYNWDTDVLATSGGEDYELLITIAEKDFKSINKAFIKQFNKALYAFGRITEDGTNLTWKKKGETVILDHDGFDHFSSAKNKEQI